MNLFSTILEQCSPLHKLPISQFLQDWILEIAVQRRFAAKVRAPPLEEVGTVRGSGWVDDQHAKLPLILVPKT
jgi:hypothetical protein